ncbi:unnamed protein product [Effrenium voratum]|uniref:Uncharacterized protein n=1 Tax=Effrenium voratum TaxID=2562239 RepID=A0AA36IAM3_9DINO|nr:unnamed protein product [Effrenium voratum]
MAMDLSVDMMPEDLFTEAGVHASDDEAMKEAEEGGEAAAGQNKGSKRKRGAGPENQEKGSQSSGKKSDKSAQGEGMSFNQAFCHKDKYKLDQLGRLAKNQQKTEWFKTVRQDENKVQRLLKAYRDVTGDDGEGSKKKVNSSTLFQSLETMVAGSRITFQTECEMMPEDMYLRYATEVLTEMNGRLTRAQAVSQWSTWQAAVEADGETNDPVHDWKGKNKCLRIAVPVHDKVILANFFEKSKGAVLKEKEEKGITESQLAAKKKALFQNNEKFGSFNDEQDAKDLAGGMIRAAGQSAAGNAFIGQAMEVNLDELVKEAAAEAAKAAEGEQGSASESEPEAPNGSKTGSKGGQKGKGGRGQAKVWFDRDTAIASRVRTEGTALCTMELQLQARLDECQQYLQEVQSKPCLHEVKVEYSTLTKRVEFLEAVLSPQGSGLTSLIQKYEEPKANSAPPAATSPAKASATEPSTAWQAQLQSAPPCASYASLTCLSSHKDSVDAFWKCQTAAELKELAKTRAVSRKPLGELSNSVNAGLKELKKAVASCEQRAAKRASKGGGKGAQKEKVGGNQQAVFEQGITCAQEVSAVSLTSLKSGAEKLPAMCMPILVNLGEHAACLAKEPMAAQSTAFKTAFAEKIKAMARSNMSKPPEQRTKARAAAKLSQEALDAWSAFESVLPAELILGAVPGSTPSPTAGLPSHLGIQAGSVAAGAETDWLASIRLLTAGTRTLVIASLSKLVQVFGRCEPSSLWKRFLDMTPKEAAELGRVGALQAVTHGPQELLYLPCGWIFAEKVMDNADLAGFVVRGVTAKDTHAFSELTLLNNMLTEHSKPALASSALLSFLSPQAPPEEAEQKEAAPTILAESQEQKEPGAHDQAAPAPMPSVENTQQKQENEGKEN